MRFLERHPEFGEPLKVSAKRKQDLENWLSTEIDLALASRQGLEDEWRTSIRLYNAIPEMQQRNVPYVMAHNHVIPLSAIAVDAIYAQVLTNITQIKPFVVVRPTNGAYQEHARAVQKRVELGAPVWGFYSALCDLAKDACKLGTGVTYTRWYETRIKTKRARIAFRGPRITSIPVENVLVPGGAYGDLDNLPWISLIYYMTKAELQEKANLVGWDISPNVGGTQTNTVRRAREYFTRQYGDISQGSELCDVHEIYCHFDIDNDGEQEELLVVYDHNVHQIYWMDYAPYDHRPHTVARFNNQEYLFYGQSVVDMVKELNTIASDTLNHWLDNAFLANCRMFATPHGTLDAEQTIFAWAGRNIKMADPEKLREIRLSDEYTSMPQIIAMIMGLAERRTGINDLSSPRPSQVLGSRTPGITALSLLQQVSNRQTPAFDNIRNAASEALKQCIYREQERVLSGDTFTIQYLQKLLGPEDAGKYIEILNDTEFDDACTIEMAASSASVNKEAERQNLMMFGQQVFRQYVMDLVQAGMMISNPQAPPLMKEIVLRASEGYSKIVERIMTTFDQFRDPENFLISLLEGQQAAAPQQQQFEQNQQEQQNFAQILPLLGGLLGGAGQQSANASNGQTVGAAPAPEPAGEG
jgi:hypothetical protein